MFTAISSRTIATRQLTRISRSAIGSSQPYSSTMHDNDPDVIEAEKRRNLSGNQSKTSTTHSPHAPGWNEVLASSSEASVKADRSDHKSPADMQKATIDYLKTRHSPEEAPTQAQYLADSVAGPLGKVVGGVKKMVEKATSTETPNSKDK